MSKKSKRVVDASDQEVFEETCRSAPFMREVFEGIRGALLAGYSAQEVIDEMGDLVIRDQGREMDARKRYIFERCMKHLVAEVWAGRQKAGLN